MGRAVQGGEAGYGGDVNAFKPGRANYPNRTSKPNSLIRLSERVH